MVLVLKPASRKQILSVAQKLPLKPLVELGAPEALKALVHEIEIEGISSDEAVLLQNLKDSCKKARIKFLERIAGDNDPALRELLIRLLSLDFVRNTSFNCSGHPPFGLGYALFELDLSTRVKNEAAKGFVGELRGINVIETSGEIGSYFETRLRPNSIESLYPEVEIRLRRRIRRDHSSPRSRNLNIEDPETLVKVWTEFGDRVSMFETAPRTTHLRADLFEPGEPGGSGYAGGLIFRDVLRDIISKETEILASCGLEPFFLRINSHYEQAMLRLRDKQKPSA